MSKYNINKENSIIISCLAYFVNDFAPFIIFIVILIAIMTTYVCQLHKVSIYLDFFANAEYLAMIDRSMDQLSSGNGKQHELIEVDDD